MKADFDMRIVRICMKLEKRGCWSCLSMTCEFIAFVNAQKKKRGGETVLIIRIFSKSGNLRVETDGARSTNIHLANSYLVSRPLCLSRE